MTDQEKQLVLEGWRTKGWAWLIGYMAGNAGMITNRLRNHNESSLADAFRHSLLIKESQELCFEHISEVATDGD